jgi:hydrogenase maturation factor
MGFNWLSGLAGFAERQTEMRDEARKDALKLAKDTLNYRVEMGMEKRRAKRKLLDDSVKLGRSMINNYGFTIQQIGVLASQGKLEQVAELYDKASTDPNYKGKLPDPKTIVSVMEDKPVDMPFEDYMRSVVIGTPDTSRTLERDISGMGANKPDSLFSGFDPYRPAREYAKEYEKSLGMGMGEISSYAFDAHTPEQVRGKVSLEDFRTGMKAARDDILYGKLNSAFADTIGNTMGLSSDFSPTGEFLGFKERGARSNQAQIVVDAAIEDARMQLSTTEKPYEVVVRDTRLKLMDPRSIQDYYNKSTGKMDEVVDIPNTQTATTTTTPTTAAQNAQGPVGGVPVLFDDDTVNLIMSAPDKKSLEDIVMDIQTKPGMSDEADRLRRILINRDLTLEQKKQEIIRGSSSAPAKIERPNETPKPRTAPRMRGKKETSGVENVMGPEQVAALSDKLKAQNIDTTDIKQVRTALVQMTDPMRKQAREQFQGPAERFDAIFIRQLADVANMIAADSVRNMA